jgi:CHAD domain-containing protein
MGGALLHRQRKRIKGMRRQLFALGPAALHDLRIEVKKLRYAVDFLAPTAADPPRRAPICALGQVQDALGALHDRAEAEATLALACHGPWLPPAARGQRILPAACAPCWPRAANRARS